MTPKMFAVLIIALAVLAITWGPISYVAWKRVPLVQPYKAIYSISCFPLFLILMVMNIWLIGNLAPGLLDAAQTQSGALRKAREASAWIALGVASPLGIIGCYLWFKLLAIRGKLPS